VYANSVGSSVIAARAEFFADTVPVREFGLLRDDLAGNAAG